MECQHIGVSKRSCDLYQEENLVMKIFLSSSGYSSHKVAELFKHILSQLFPNIDIFYSIDDIQKGKHWVSDLEKRLANAEIGIICLTQGNISSPWIMYEASRLSSLTKHVILLLIDVDNNQLKSTPLSSLQSIQLSHDGLVTLVHEINHRLSIHEKQPDSLLFNDRLEAVWQFIQTELAETLNKKPVRVIKTTGVLSLLVKDKVMDAVKEVTQRRLPPSDGLKIAKQNEQ